MVRGTSLDNRLAHLGLLQIDHGDNKLYGQCLDDLVLGDAAHAHEDLAELAAMPLLLKLEGFRELLPVDMAHGDEKIADR